MTLTNLIYGFAGIVIIGGPLLSYGINKKLESELKNGERKYIEKEWCYILPSITKLGLGFGALIASTNFICSVGEDFELKEEQMAEELYEIAQKNINDKK